MRYIGRPAPSFMNESPETAGLAMDEALQMSVAKKRKRLPEEASARPKTTKSCAVCKGQMHIRCKTCPHCKSKAQSLSKNAVYLRNMRRKKILRKKKQEEEQRPNRCIVCHTEEPDMSGLSVFCGCECDRVQYIGCRGCLLQYVEHCLKPQNHKVGASMRVGPRRVVHIVQTRRPVVKCLICNAEARPRKPAVDLHGNPVPAAHLYLKRLGAFLQSKVNGGKKM